MRSEAAFLAAATLESQRDAAYAALESEPEQGITSTVALSVVEEGQPQNANITYSGESETSTLRPK